MRKKKIEFKEAYHKYVSPLNRESIIKSLEQLTLLGSLADDRKLSDPVGWQMARLPLPPIYSRALIKASELKCLDEMLISIAMLSVESTFAPCGRLDEVYLHVFYLQTY